MKYKYCMYNLGLKKKLSLPAKLFDYNTVIPATAAHQWLTTRLL